LRAFYDKVFAIIFFSQQGMLTFPFIVVPVIIYRLKNQL